MNQGGRDDVEGVDVAAHLAQRTQDVAHMDDADDVVGLVPPQRQARVRRGQHLVEHRARRIVRVEAHHGAAVHHDLAHFDLRQIQHAPEHGALVLDHLVLALVQLDRAAQLLRRRDDGLVRLELDADQPHRAAHDPVGRP
jgi:hypothetical protein